MKGYSGLPETVYLMLSMILLINFTFEENMWKAIILLILGLVMGWAYTFLLKNGSLENDNKKEMLGK